MRECPNLSALLTIRSQTEKKLLTKILTNCRSRRAPTQNLRQSLFHSRHTEWLFDHRHSRRSQQRFCFEIKNVAGQKNKPRTQGWAERDDSLIKFKAAKLRHFKIRNNQIKIFILEALQRGFGVRFSKRFVTDKP